MKNKNLEDLKVILENSLRGNCIASVCQEENPLLFDYLESLKGGIVFYKNTHYLATLIWIYDIPSFELIQLDMENILQLEEG